MCKIHRFSVDCRAVTQVASGFMIDDHSVFNDVGHFSQFNFFVAGGAGGIAVVFNAGVR